MLPDNGSYQATNRKPSLEQWNGEWRYLESLQVTNLITAEPAFRSWPVA
jgi:hypothetical protein